MPDLPRILLGVSGSIAIVKAPELVRLLQRMPAEVRVAMTAGAARMIAPVTFEALTSHSVYATMWDSADAYKMEHLSWAKWAEVFVIAPASADVIADLATGRADNAVTSTALAYRGPLVICPAMNPAMYDHPATRANVETLRARGATILGPAGGEALCGDEGVGRLEEPAVIVARLASLLSIESPRVAAPAPSPLRGRRVLITAGATREFIDPVRFISNASSGKMGFAIAAEAARRGAEVDLIAGATEVPPPAAPNIHLHRVTSAADMHAAALSLAPAAHLCIFAAAVADFTPAAPAPRKIKKDGRAPASAPAPLTLARTRDIAADVGALAVPGQVRVGFAAETDDLRANARAKLARKHLHLICANDVTRPGAGFGSDRNELLILRPDGTETLLPLQDKSRLGGQLLDLVEKELLARPPAAAKASARSTPTSASKKKRS